jgi:DNA-binding response OmpR family regulator
MTYEFGNISVDFVRLKLFKNGTSISLSTKEWDLFRFLVNNRGQVASRDMLLGHVWAGQKLITPRTVDVHISWLRQKLEDNPKSPAHILTVRGEGYRFVA